MRGKMMIEGVELRSEKDLTEDEYKDLMYKRALRDIYRSICDYVESVKDIKQEENFMSCVAIDILLNALYTEYSKRSEE